MNRQHDYPVYPWHWIEEDLKPKCAVKDLKGNHCPEPPKHRINKDTYLCGKCYKNYLSKMYSERRYSILDDKTV